MLKNYLIQNKIYFIALLVFLAVYELRVNLSGGFIHAHMSNAALSGLAVLLMGPHEFKTFSRPFRAVAVVMLFMNSVLEFGQSIAAIGDDKIVFLDFNTADPWDGVFGIMAVLALGYASYTVRARERSRANLVA